MKDCRCGCGRKIKAIDKWGRRRYFASGHYNRRINTPNDFWRKVIKTQGCWNWAGTVLNKRGYGQFCHNGKISMAHRYSWELTNGVIRNGLNVLHRCDNRKCVNPKHLWLGTLEDNMRDMVLKGRSYHPIGELHPNSKLKWDDIENIRRSFHTKNFKSVDIAKKFAVTRATINRITSMKGWHRGIL